MPVRIYSIDKKCDKIPHKTLMRDYVLWRKAFEKKIFIFYLV